MKIRDKRYKQLMKDVGMPNSKSLLLALKQCAIESALAEREELWYGPDVESERGIDMDCTWKGCHRKAKSPQFDKHGQEWASLCEEHDKLLTKAFATKDVPKILSCWVKAKGGAEEASKKF